MVASVSTGSECLLADC